LLKGVVFLCPLIASVAQAQSGSENQNLFGQLGQLNGGVTYVNPNYSNSIAVGPNACVPTSVANGLVFLNNFYGGSLFQNYNPNGYTTVNNLAAAMGTFNMSNYQGVANVGGTWYGTQGAGFAGVATPPNEVTGLANYIGPTGANPAPSVFIVGGQYVSSIPGISNGNGIPAGLAPNFANTIPTAQYLANALNADQAVELTIQWGNYNAALNTFTAAGGLHSITLTSIADVSGVGTATFWDPWGATAQYITANLLTSTDGYLYFTNMTVTDPTAGTGDDLPDGGLDPNGRIVTDLAEAVPEPMSFGYLTVGVISLCAWRMRRR